MSISWDVLVVSSDLEGRRSLSDMLGRQGLDPICSPTIAESLGILFRQPVGLVFCDRNLSDGTYKDLLAALRSSTPRARVVVISRHGDWDENLESMRLGAFDCIPAPCCPTDVEWMIIQAQRDERNHPRPAASPETARLPHAQTAAS